MFENYRTPQALLIINSPHYNEKLNDFLLNCDWQTLKKKWKKFMRDSSYNDAVDFIFFDEAPDWLKQHQYLVDEHKITASMLEECRPFSVQRDYVHKALDIPEVSEPSFILLPFHPSSTSETWEILIGRSSIELYADEDILTQLEYFLEMKLSQYQDHVDRGVHHNTQAYNPYRTIIEQQESRLNYNALSIEGIKTCIGELEYNLHKELNEEKKVIIQIQIEVLKDKFLNGKLSVGTPDIEINHRDDIQINGHLRLSIALGRARDKALYFYFLCRAKHKKSFISFDNMQKQSELKIIESIHKEIQGISGHSHEIDLQDRSAFSQLVSRVKKHFKENIADHLVEEYQISKDEFDRYGVRLDPEKIEIHKNSSLGMYLRLEVS
jgi:hypothetical protein